MSNTAVPPAFEKPFWPEMQSCCGCKAISVPKRPCG